MLATLFDKVMVLLACCMFISAGGTYIGRNIRSVGAVIGLGITFLVGSIAVYIMADSVAPGTGIALLFAWTFVSGLFLGPTFSMFVAENGWKVLLLIFAGTMGTMAIAGSIGMFSGIDFSGMGIVLCIALLGLIIVSVVGIFVRMSREMNIGFALIGCVIFTLYFVYDFFRLGHTENTWGHAIQLTMHIYLDIVNLMLQLMQLYEATKHH